MEDYEQELIENDNEFINNNGLFHTNKIENLWNRIKNYADNFSGLSIENLKKKFNNDSDLIRDYLDGWITYTLLIREFKRRHLSWPQRIKLLCEYLKHN